MWQQAGEASDNITTTVDQGRIISLLALGYKDLVKNAGSFVKATLKNKIVVLRNPDTDGHIKKENLSRNFAN